MKTLERLLERNRNAVRNLESGKPEWLEAIAAPQKPDIYWIGCSDSRTAPERILQAIPGELFVRRGIANQFRPEESGDRALLHFAVNVLGVCQIVVCGHTDCGGVLGSLQDGPSGALDEWLEPIRGLRRTRQEELAGLETGAQERKLSEWNVIHQVELLRQSDVVRQAWKEGRPLSVSGLLLDLKDPRLHKLISYQGTASGEGIEA